jgi:hypothetical protein
MACCSELTIPQDDDYSATEDSDESNVKHSRSKRNSDSNEKKKRFEVPYAHATPLFKAIEKQQWESVLMFLNTSKWSNSFFVSTTDHMKNPTPFIQCQTWVTAHDTSSRRIEWSQLPIHAAITYAAPAVVIQKLVDLYPESLRMLDHERMLPVHLAFGFALPDTVISLLLKEYPGSAQERGPGGRLPHQCCELGPNKVRGEVFGMIAEQTSDLTRKDQENTWKKFISDFHKQHEIEDPNFFEDKDLKSMLSELMEDRKQLLDLKKKIQKTSENETPDASQNSKVFKKGKSPRSERKKSLVSPKVVDESNKLSCDTSMVDDTQNLSLKETSLTSQTPQSQRANKYSSSTLISPKSTKSSKVPKARLAQ